MRPTGPYLAGIVLVGGAGRRIGAPKALLRLGGATLAERAVAIAAGVCDEVLVVTRPEVPVHVAGARVVHDQPGPDAPLTGIATGLAAATADEVLVLACDLPFAAPAAAALLAGPQGSAAIATAGGRAQPLCARYPRRAALHAAHMLLASGSVRAFALAGALGARHVPVPPSTLFNINGTDDLRRARAAEALLHAAHRPVSSGGSPTVPFRTHATVTAEGAR